MGLFSKSSPDRSGDDSIETPDDRSLLGDEYQIDPDTLSRVGNKIVSVTETNEGEEESEKIWAGPAPRRLFERARDNPQQALWVGYTEDTQTGFREAPIKFSKLFEHIWISGKTGSGKSTMEKNILLQWIYAGYGCVYFDPKGKDSRDLLRKIPEDRLDDVIWIEPGSTNFEKNIGINFLEVPEFEQEEEQENAIEDRIENLKAIFDTSDYWGINMESITESMGRAMMKSDKDYSIIDMFFILLNQDRREDFAQKAISEDTYLMFLQEIAEMDDDEIRPLLKRIKTWVENPVTRRIIAKRESSINFRDVIDNDKIVIVRTPTTNKDIKAMNTLGVMREVWSAVQQRSYETDKTPRPFFIVCDEFDDIASPNLDMVSMLARARSMRLSVTLACQYPTQLDEDTQKAMKNNCDHLLAFRTTDEDDAGSLMSRFRGYSKTDLIESNNFEVWARLPGKGGSYSNPLKLQTFPEYPPLRSIGAVNDVIEKSLDNYGDPPITDEKIQRELPIGSLEEAFEFDEEADGEIQVDTDSSTPDAGEVQRKVALESVFVAAARDQRFDIHADLPPVEESAVHDEFNRRSPHPELSLSEFSNVMEKLDADGILEKDRLSGESVVSITDDGIVELFDQDTGSGGSGGGKEHRLILKWAFRTFISLGASVELPTQDGDSLPDGLAELPIKPLDARSRSEFKQMDADLEEHYPTLYTISDDRDLSIEAETSTLKKGGQTLTNLAKAFSEGNRCIFAVKDATAAKNRFEYWARRGERAIYQTTGSGQGIEENYDELTFVSGTTDKGRVFFSKPHQFEIAPNVFALRPAETERMEWREKDGSLVIVEKDGEGTVRSEFDGPVKTALDDVNPEDVPATYEHDPINSEYVVKHNDEKKVYETKEEMRKHWKEIAPPFIPEREFIDSTDHQRLPGPDDFTFIVYPDSDNTEYDEPQIYEQGELTPLSELSSGELVGDTQTPQEPPEEPAGETGTESPEETSERSEDNLGRYELF